ncbi:MAG: Holliday junction branch migration protein RuvA [Rhodospirillaceae bacterium]|nr:Holliday junction branch migration protein RuvA [Rhodospirillaceae bacterium]OUT78267.1 MAG: Holliday junction branch migration protein RuvA [Rhodospirillaceae bacterium TMED23]|tara:strand:+ start:1063 stop:1686 length:624 start_codon:yes stop_codon:yes gene_type:complete
MIAKLTGVIDQINEDSVIIDVNGVGYLVFCSNFTLNSVKSHNGLVSILVEMHVREDHIHLFGFCNEEEKIWFNLLRTVQGVGAKVCLGILSTLSSRELTAALRSEDKASITKAPGVGAKLATRIVTELKDKFEILIFGSSPSTVTDYLPSKELEEDVQKDSISALVNLGYTKSDAFRAIQLALEKIGDNPSVEILIKEALQELIPNG